MNACTQFCQTSVVMAKHDSDEEGMYEGADDGMEDYGVMVERSRPKVKKRSPYFNEAVPAEEEWEEEAEPRNEDEEVMEILKMEQSEDFCHVCGLGGKLLCCDTCPAVYHLGCLDPPLKIAPMGKWSCPICVDPLENLEKIVDCQMRPLKSPGTVEDPAGSSSGRLVKQYLVKWKGRSYLHCSWVRQEELEKGIKSFPGIRMKLNSFQRQVEAAKRLSISDEDRVFVRPEWTTVDRILDTRQNGDVKEYFVKWKDLGYDELTWELEADIAPFQTEISKHSALLQKGATRALMKRKMAAGLDVKEAKRRRKEFKTYKKTPKFLVGGALLRFQLEGLNFLRFSWQQEKNVILADEVGLGKTVQAVSFLAALGEEGVTFSLPHLVVAPTPTLQNWEREFSTWAPHLNVVNYSGSSDARAYIRDFEFYYSSKLKGLNDKIKKKQVADLRQSKQERIKFDVLLTSHEMAGLDLGVLKSISWECLIIDEGHRLKNKDVKLFSSLESLSTHQHILLTGAPLPSNMEDLLMLMRFLGAGKFSSLEEFREDFSDLHHEEQIVKLQKLLAPHMFRRVKREVMREMPAKRELILRVELTSLQKEYYRGILSRNYQILSRPGGPQFALNNVMMELRKLCAHPFMLDGAEPDARSEQEANRQLLEASEKLGLLERMMARLRVQGHRVLIYSQFARMLDLLEEWLLYKKWGYERIDGKTNGAERQVRIDRFNAQNSTRFCFLLSTQAGVGINLAAADTVIIYDSDWNSHADLQAMGRPHVMIFRLVTRGTIEERMMQTTKRRTVIEHLMMGRVKAQAFSQEELDDMLKYGTKELFGDDMGRARPICYDDNSIERLLNRSHLDGGDEKLGEKEAAELARVYKTPNYDILHEEDVGEDLQRHMGADRSIARLDSSDRSYFWHNLLRDKGERQHHSYDSDDHRGKRNRKQYSGQPVEEDDLAGLADVSSEDEDYDYSQHDENDSASGYMRERFQPPKKRAREELIEEQLEPAPLMEGEGRSLKVLGFTQKQRAIFVQVLMRYGLGDFTWSDFIPRLKQKRREEIKDYGTLFLSHIAEDINDSLTFSDGVPKEGLRIQDVLVRLAVLHLIGDKVRSLMDNPEAPLLSIGARNHRYYSLRNTKVWKEEHDRRLLQAILKLGYGRWQAIVDEPELGLQSVIRNEILLRENAGDGRPIDGEGGTVISTQIADSHLDGGSDDKGSDDELPLDGVGPGSNKETSEAYMQKKMVDFVKRRVLVLEKVLNAEYLKDSVDPGGVEEESPAAVDPRSKNSSAGRQDGPDGKGQNSINKPPLLYPMPLAEEEISAAAVDDDPNRLKVAEIYGKMCELMLENQGDADQAYVGNKSAGLRLRKSLRQLDTLCLEMRKALFGQPLQSRKVRTKPDDPEGVEVDPQSDDNENENDNDEAGVDSENENEIGNDVDNDNDAKLEEIPKPSSSSETAHSSADEPSPEEHVVGREDSSDNEEKPRKRFEPLPRANIGGTSVTVKIEQSSAGLEGSSGKRFKGPKLYLTPKPQYSESP